MRKTFFTFFCLCAFIFNVQAQYVFNSCSYRPAYGDSLIGNLNQYDSTGVTPGSAGANITWNYSSIALTYTYTLSHHYCDPAATSGSYMFPSADVADLGSGLNYSYYKYNPDSVTFLGDYHDSVNFHRSWDPKLQSVCPLGFGNSFSDRFNRYNFGQCPYHHTYSTRSISYDGYGTLNLPHHNYAAVRLKIIERTLDTSICIGPPVIVYYLDSTYLWIDTLTAQPVFSLHYFIDTANHYANKIVEEYAYSHLPATVLTSISSLTELQSDFTIYPNPTSGVFNLQISKLENVQIKIYDVLGECIYQHISTSANQQIDLSFAPAGVYFIQLKTADGVAVKKIVKQ